MEMLSIEKELQGNAYPGRGIIIGKTPDGTKAVAAYFIMGRSENSRNRVFVTEGEGIRTQAYDPQNSQTQALSFMHLFVYWATEQLLRMVIRQIQSMI